MVLPLYVLVDGRAEQCKDFAEWSEIFPKQRIVANTEVAGPGGHLFVRTVFFGIDDNFPEVSFLLRTYSDLTSDLAPVLFGTAIVNPETGKVRELWKYSTLEEA